MKADLCGALSLFAGVVLKNRKLIHRIVWEDWMGLERSVIAQEWIRMGMKKGIEKGHRRGMIEALKGAILSVLKIRFGRVDRGLETRIQTIRNLEILDRLLARAVVARSPKAFLREISS
jgi:hypothetical protein